MLYSIIIIEYIVNNWIIDYERYILNQKLTFTDKLDESLFLLAIVMDISWYSQARLEFEEIPRYHSRQYLLVVNPDRFICRTFSSMDP